MSLLSATLRLYGAAARDAGAAFVRSGTAFAWLVLAGGALLALNLSGIQARAGIIGGVIVSILRAGAAGTYLACVQDALASRRALGVEGVRGNLGAYTSDIINALFPIWIAELVVRLLGVDLLAIALSAAVFLFLNPLPEMIGRVRASGTELLGEAWQFMGRAGPEWLAAQVAFMALAWLLVPGLGLLAALGALLPVFSPEMGFMEAATFVWMRAGLSTGVQAADVGRAVALVALVHMAMLFRGALYDRLSGSSRRARAWSEQLSDR